MSALAEKQAMLAKLWEEQMKRKLDKDIKDKEESKFNPLSKSVASTNVD